jgi:hypothetical protein
MRGLLISEEDLDHFKAIVGEGIIDKLTFALG